MKQLALGLGRFKAEHPVTKLGATMTCSAIIQSSFCQPQATRWAISHCLSDCRKLAPSFSAGMPSTSRTIGTIGECQASMSTPTRRLPQCSELPK
jgi:hypothetical protein